MAWMSDWGFQSDSSADADLVSVLVSGTVVPDSFLGDDVLVGEGSLNVSPHALYPCLSESGIEVRFSILGLVRMGSFPLFTLYFFLNLFSMGLICGR